MDKNTTKATEKDDENWDLILQPKVRSLDSKHIRELIRYRDLILLFIKRDFTTQYKQTILGPLWYLVQPLVTTVCYTFVFGKLANIGTDEVPYMLFYFAGTMLWTYFTGVLNSAAGIFSSNSGIFGKVYFPRLTVPISTTVGQMIKLALQFMCLLVFYFYFIFKGAPVHPSWKVCLFPLLVLWIGFLGCGLGMIVSSLTTKYRDLNQLLGFGLSLAMYATPIVYPLSQAPEKFQWFFYINPMSAPIELFRIWFYGAGHVPVTMTLISLAVTGLCFFFGLILFNKNERTFVDVI